jgi:murein L,D-transpeptidase YafK
MSPMKIPKLLGPLTAILALVGCAVPSWADKPVAMQLAAADAASFLGSPDALLGKALEEIRASHMDNALRDVDQLISMRPDFKLAYLIRGDLLMARAKPLTSFGDAPRATKDSLSDLKEEARVRLLRYLDQPDPNLLPKQILQLQSEEKYALLADAGRARLYLFENVNGIPRLIHDYYMTIGRNGLDKRTEGDKRTPEGAYYLSEHLPSSRLSDFYGVGAFPLNYPNAWDQMHGRNGHGIWLHGTPFNTYSRPPRSSDGCVVVSNPDLTELSHYVGPGTPIVIADHTEWVDPVVWEASRQEILSTLDQWRTDWESRNVERFFRHYPDDLITGKGHGWAASKRRNIVSKDWIHVGISDVSIFLYPDSDLAVVTFQQQYTSDKFTNTTWKRLYWRKQDGHWSIALEKTLTSPTQVADGRR